jgi:hypothetical protein
MNEADRALRALEQAQVAFADADERRREAMRVASEAGCTLRQIQTAVDRSLSYEGIRTIVGPRSGVVFEWRGDQYPISEPQTRALIYKAETYGAGGGRGDIEKYDLGTDWLPAATTLARAMRRVHVGTDVDPIKLDEPHARALKPILQMTYTNGMTPISDLRQRLFTDLGRPTPKPRYGLVG